MLKQEKNRIRLVCFICVLVISMTLSSTSAAGCGSQSGKNRYEADTVTIVMAGDVLMHDKVIRSGLRTDGSYDFDGLFSHVKNKIGAADIAIVNQETILGGKELGYTGYPSFNSPTEVGDAEAKAGFDVILQGTNHALDRSARGIENCLSFWDKTYPDIEVLGIHDSEKDRQEICIIECKGIKTAILNYTYGTNGIQMPKGKGYLVDYLDEKRVREDIAKAEKQADFTIVCPHWGTEYSLEVSSYQEKWAQIFLECGADLCIGTHPHVIEPMEVLKDDKGHEMPVYYSLGNFVNYTSGTGKGVMNRMVGGIAEIKIGRDKSGRVRVLENSVRPIVCHLSKEEIAAYYLDDYTAELAGRNLIRAQDPDFSLEACEELADKVWGGR
ncbi:MAG: CapA family protein [Lachnospiraceae bacterium]|nr:CapA family protein [Lachnospiraceae bacterium]